MYLLTCCEWVGTYLVDFYLSHSPKQQLIFLTIIPVTQLNCQIIKMSEHTQYTLVPI